MLPVPGSTFQEWRVCGAQGDVPWRAGRVCRVPWGWPLTGDVHEAVGVADGERFLAGGRMGGVRLVDGTVRRPVRPWSSGVRALLRRLDAVGFQGAQRHLGVDDEGRDIFSYLRGDTLGEPGTWPAWVWSETLLSEVAVWLRGLHDATLGWRPPSDVQWFAGRDWSEGLIIGHQDAAPWNVVVRDGHVVGFCDWDIAGPSSRELDLAWSALTWVPLLAEGVLALPVSDRVDRARRLHLLLDGYGYDGDRVAFGVTVARRARINAEAVTGMAAAGDPLGVSMMPWAGSLEASAREVESLPASFWTQGERP